MSDTAELKTPLLKTALIYDFDGTLARGNMQEVKELWADCDSDTLLVKVDSPGPACHTGNRTCFFKRVKGGTR